MKVFITQGGLQSTDEAITAGVPLIGVPMLGDQWFNVEQYIRFNIGIKLSIQTITEDSLKNAIETVVKNERLVKKAFFVFMFYNAIGKEYLVSKLFIQHYH